VVQVVLLKGVRGMRQVCHHPPISAWMVESTCKEPELHYSMYGEVEFRTKFWGAF
jgi:hypothetical protein